MQVLLAHIMMRCVLVSITNLAKAQFQIIPPTSNGHGRRACIRPIKANPIIPSYYADPSLSREAAPLYECILGAKLGMIPTKCA